MAVADRTRSAAARSWRRDQRLAALGFEDYSAYLASATWADLKARYRAADLPQACLLCGSADRIILHHRTYDRVGEEQLEDLAPLCGGCHELVHAMETLGYIDSLNPEAVEALTDPQRAAANRIIAEARDTQRRDEIRAAHAGDEARREARSLGHRLRDGLLAAAKAEADVSPELAQIKQAIANIEERLG